MKQCPVCRNYNEDYAKFCSQCGHSFEPERKEYDYNNQRNYQTPPPYTENNDPFTSCSGGKSRGVAALLAIFLGSIGVHYFYLGKAGAGIICILLTIVTCGLWAWLTFAQGIYMFCINNEQFCEKYVNTTSTFPLF